MSDLYLIAHKAHGKATFDVAERQPCAECGDEGCDECDGLGYWWITSTGGWRVYPWWTESLNYLHVESLYPVISVLADMPPSARELYNPLARDPEPAKPSQLALSLGLIKPVTIKRRI